MMPESVLNENLRQSSMVRAMCGLQLKRELMTYMMVMVGLNEIIDP